VLFSALIIYCRLCNIKRAPSYGGSDLLGVVVDGGAATGTPCSHPGQWRVFAPTSRRPADAAARHLTPGVFCPECWQREIGGCGQLRSRPGEGTNVSTVATLPGAHDAVRRQVEDVLVIPVPRHIATLTATVHTRRAGMANTPESAIAAPTTTSTATAPTHASQRPKTAVLTISQDVAAIESAAARSPPVPVIA